MADRREACVQLDGALSRASGAAYRAAKHIAAASLCVQALCRAVDLPRDGLSGKRWRDPARDVRSQPSGLPSIQLRTAERHGIAAPTFSGARPAICRNAGG